MKLFESFCRVKAEPTLRLKVWQLNLSHLGYWADEVVRGRGDVRHHLDQPHPEGLQPQVPGQGPGPPNFQVPMDALF